MTSSELPSSRFEIASVVETMQETQEAITPERENATCENVNSCFCLSKSAICRNLSLSQATEPLLQPSSQAKVDLK